MNILIDTKSSLKASLLNYMCMRMKFRGSVLGGDANTTKPESYKNAPCVFGAEVKH